MGHWVSLCVKCCRMVDQGVCTKMVTISILANTVRPSVDHRLDDAAFGAGTFSYPVHSWKAGPGEVMTVEKIIYLFDYPEYLISTVKL